MSQSADAAINTVDFGAREAPNEAMNRATTKIDSRSRTSLRLEPELWAAIDSTRGKRPGSISRNTWITEAIIEKLEREKGAQKKERA